MNFERIDKRYVFFIFISLVLFIIIYPIQIRTPLQSDDYSYFFKGGSVSNLYNHYMIWSGRISADFTSSSMLYFFSKGVYSALNSIALVSLAFLISWLPASISNRKLNYNDSLTFIVVFIAYWVANTNLGQTTFWIVGSANYLWTSLYFLIYCHLILLLLRSNRNKYLSSLVVFISGLISGCTNENTGIFSFLFTVFILISFEFRDKKDKCVELLFGAVGGLLGWVILLSSPGNAIRAQSSVFSYWYEQSLSWRIDEHMFVRFPKIMESYWQVFLILMFILAISNLVGKDLKPQSNNVAKASIFFLFASIISSLIMVGSPTIPLRSGNGALVFLLIAYSLASNSHEKNGFKKNIFVYLPIIIFLLMYFIPSYYLVYKAYDNIKNQEIVRNDIIKYSKGKGIEDIYIPDFYFSRLMKNGDKFDSFHNPIIMGKYWGVDAITIYPVPFNFGALAEKNTTVDVNIKLSNQMSLLRLFIYQSPSTPFFINETHLIAELNFNPEKLPKDKGVYIHLHGNGIISKGGDFVNKYKFINADIGRGKGFLIGDKYYVDRVIPQEITASDIEMVRAGMY